MTMFGTHTPYIYASYAVAALVIVLLIASAYSARASARRRLAELERLEEASR